MQKLDWTCPENDEERKAEGRLKKEDKKQTQKEDKIRRERIERERERECKASEKSEKRIERKNS